MAKTVRIVVPDEFKKWTSGLNDLSMGPQEAALLEQATEYMFSETQRRAHVLTGDMKASGKVVSKMSGQKVTTEITYGNAKVDYTQYELARGGSHDFVRPALAATRAKFESAVLRMMADLIRRKVG